MVGNFEIFKILSDESKYQILKLIYQSDHELCVSQISKTLKLSQSNTSHKLAKLKDLGFLFDVPHGNITCYKLSNNLSVTKIKKIIDLVEIENQD